MHNLYMDYVSLVTYDFELDIYVLLWGIPAH